MKLTTSDLAQMHKVDEPAQQPELDFKTANKPHAPATDRQVDYLKSLARQRVEGYIPDCEEGKECATCLHLNDVIALGKVRVSKAIDRLLSLPVLPDSERRKENQDRITNPPNKFSSRCGTCGHHVPAQEGTIRKLDSGKWQVYHKEGECPISGYPFPFGRYAVETEEGHLAFYFASEDGFFLQHGSEHSLLPAKTAQAVVEKIAKDPREASIRYGLELEHCGRCGKTLTNEESRERGIGPECAKKGWS